MIVINYVCSVFGHQLCLQSQAFLSEVTDLGGLVLDNAKFALEIADAELKQLDVFQTLLVLDLTLGEGGLENLDLLI